MSLGKLKYRPDIDGIRAIAILLVVAFHMFPNKLSGGFIGVDVFLVISGYLITSIISPQMRDGVFSFRVFYRHRMRRILPAFFVMIFIVMLAAYIFFLPSDIIPLYKTATSSSFFISNIQFMKRPGYFALDSNQLPLIHTWSLAVEEQFYFIWPSLLILSYKYFRKPIVVILITLHISVLVAVYTSYYKGSFDWVNKFAYYSIFTRGYELLIGCALAVFIGDNKPHSIFPSSFFNNIVAIAGALMILLSSIFFDSKTIFPGLAAIIPSLGCAMLIWSGNYNKTTIVNSVLSNKLMVTIGLYSYSLYLWHWPVLAFYRYFIMEQISGIDGIYLIFLIIALTLLSYNVIEKPLRKINMSFRRSLIFLQIIPSLIIVFLAFFCIKSGGFGSRDKHHMDIFEAIPSIDYCHDRYNAKCVFGDIKKTPHVLMLGDSHAQNYSPILDQFALSKNFSLIIHTASSCAPILTNIELYSQKSDICKTNLSWVNQNLDNINIVILAGRWGMYQQQYPSFGYDLNNTIKYLISRGKAVVLLGDIPNLIKLERMEFIMNNLYKNSTYLIDPAKIDYGNEVNDKIKSIANSYPQNAYYIDSSAFIGGITTFPYLNKQILYFDDSHFSANGANKVAEYIVSNHKLIELLEIINK